ncbi:MAG: glycine dehydrogenase (aminomethyl-transferring) [Deltaproteobacteria bacterium RBG_13_49_15]|nr:MAG: glycine dehydrogenase (aminomethyl-transferring) [Deltaproteobacteria bacterium RBG_13_49_15]
MRYLPHTGEEITQMLQTVGVNSLDDLFSEIPKDCCCRLGLRLPEAKTEWDLNEHMETLSARTAAGSGYKIFIGSGSYEHHIPAALTHLLGRSEFVTSYTPYQPEMAQGTLQAIYEYQTLVCRLLGMEVANASMYDGASSFAEALLMAVRITGKKKVLLSRAIHPHFRRVAGTYLSPTGYQIEEIPFDETGRTDPHRLLKSDDPAAIAVQSPNFFGCIEDFLPFAEFARETGALFIATFTEPLTFGVFKNPGSLGADISCGEGQSLGIPQSFGGPGLGIFSGKMKYVRSMPGRLVGKTRDLEGRQGFVLTLATREQHIRREKATSNICTNNSLCALASAIYMALLGNTGFHALALLNRDKTEYLKKGFQKAGFSIPFQSPTFNEFVVNMPAGFEKKRKTLMRKKMVAGFPISNLYPDLSDHYLFCATETKSKADLDALLEEAAS